MANTLPFSRGPMGFVMFVENTLGWVPPVTEKRSLTKMRFVEKAKLERKIASNPFLYTWDNLALAVEYCRRKRMQVVSPTSLCWFVKDAIHEAYRPAASTDVQVEIDQAVAWEHEHQWLDWEEWVGRLTRSAGIGRRDVLDEWKHAERGR